MFVCVQDDIPTYTCQLCFSDLSQDHPGILLPCDSVLCSNCCDSYINYVQYSVKRSDGMPMQCPRQAHPTRPCECPMLMPTLISEMAAQSSFNYIWNGMGVPVEKAVNVLDIKCGTLDCPGVFKGISWPDQQFVFCHSCRAGHCVKCRQTAENHVVVRRLLPGVKKVTLMSCAEASNATSDEDIEYVRKVSKQCPRCNMAIQKTEGCNAMSCIACNTKFCWLCLKVTPSGENPHNHFWTRDSSCYHKLFTTHPDPE